MELKELFCDGSLDFDTLEAKCKENGIKLADLSTGAYVSKDKYQKLQADFDKFKTENETNANKYADYDTLKAENEALKAEKETVGQMDAVRKAGVTEQFAEFVVSKVKPMVTAEKDFGACLKEFVAQNEQFTNQPKGNTFIYNGGNVGGQTPKPSKSLGETLNETTKALLH